MDLARWSGLTRWFMKVIGALDMHKVRVCSNILMAAHMMENGVTIKSMARVSSMMQWGANTQVSGEMTFSMVKGLRHGLMAQSLVVIMFKV